MHLRNHDSEIKVDDMKHFSFARYTSNLRNFENNEELKFFVLATELIYECNFKLTWWHRVFFPILAHRISKHQHLIRTSRGDTSIEDQLRKDVSSLEFRDKAPPSRYLHVVRVNILKSQYTQWQIRQAFNSKSISKRDQKLVISAPPKFKSVIARVLQYPLAIAACYFALSALQPGFFMGSDELLLLDLFLVGSLVCHQLGSQWIHGFKVLQHIWPSLEPIPLS
jgi:hypothetical protein